MILMSSGVAEAGGVGWPARALLRAPPRRCVFAEEPETDFTATAHLLERHQQ